MLRNAPLLSFASFEARDRFCSCLGLVDSGCEARSVEECFVEEYVTSDMRRKSINVSVVRTNAGLNGFVQKVTRLASHFYGPVFVFHASLPREQDRPGFTLNPPFQRYANALGIPLNDSQRAFLATFETHTAQASALRPMLARPSPPGFGSVRLRSPITDLEEIFAAQRHDGSSDEEMQQAIRQSIADQEREAQERAKVVVALPKDWDSVLKPNADALDPGCPECIVCRVSKASICFVPCGHQVCCDDCVRIMKTRTDLVKTCPTCRAPVDTIVRPILSQLAPMPLPLAAAAAAQPVAKKRRVTKKT